MENPMSNLMTIPHNTRVIKATEARLERIYEVAKMGLKGDSLALAAGLTPQEYRVLSQMDPAVELMAQQGKADAEMLHASKLAEASLNGDAKASLAILQHVHGWQSKEAAAKGFGEGGITINITGVTSPYAQRDDRSGVTIDG
jgi:hypothetical protein